MPRPKDQVRMRENEFIKSEQIKRIFGAIGYNYKAGKFEGIFQRAQEIVRILLMMERLIIVFSIQMQTTGDVSVKAFMKAVQEMDELQNNL